jgi:nucleotidyltransferase/DNA polymerase involved in DNA repair
MTDISQWVDKAHEQKDIDAIVKLPLDALQGVSKSDAEAIQKALGIKTIRQLAEHKFVRIAQALTTLADSK